MKKFILLVLLVLPAFSLMLRPGIWTMHDFHVFRQYEFDLCAKEKTFPCRWAPDTSLGFGSPLFNFYAQFPYWIGQIFITLGFQVIDSVKILFLLSLLLSAFSMYLLASRFWGRLGGLVSAVFYVYAPYRAVDVWVRGALPEALAFVFFPLILYFLETKKYLPLSCSLALLLITHNLSLFMFLPFLVGWWLVRSRELKVIQAGLLTLLLTSFYWLPVVFESGLVRLPQTTADYYSYPLHFTSLRQLFISNFWGYGGSTWGPNDTMSFSVGYLHWLVIPLLGLLFLLRRRLDRTFLLCTIFGLSALFLTHGKSEFIWKMVPGLAYIQFPWRFLSMSALFLSLAAGTLAKVSRNRLLLSSSLTFLLLLNAPFFRPDIWRPVTDADQFSGSLWREQISSALTDFWPASALAPPASPAPAHPQTLIGEAFLTASSRGAHIQEYGFEVTSSYAKVRFPTVYFPGWSALIDHKIAAPFASGELSLTTLRIPEGTHSVRLEFRDTLVRTLGNLISTLSVLGVISWLAVGRRHV